MTHDRPIPFDLVARVDAARVLVGFTVTELASACSVSGGHLQAVLDGEVELTPAVARRLLAVLHMHETAGTDLMHDAVSSI
jgi:hypothetical protein